MIVQISKESIVKLTASHMNAKEPSLLFEAAFYEVQEKKMYVALWHSGVVFYCISSLPIVKEPFHNPIDFNNMYTKL